MADRPVSPEPSPDTLAGFQRQIERIYFTKDSGRGLEGSFMWFVEEVGELSRVLRRGTPAQVREEFSDVLAWLATLASIVGVELAEAGTRYAAGCPKCHATPCGCAEPVPPEG
jgi:NTP pyrophosphatase (non-canonical NTP hydrolase)